MSRFLTTTGESCRPPFLFHGLPGAGSLCTNAWRVQTKTHGEPTGEAARGCARASRPPAWGRPAITAIQLVLSDVRVEEPAVARQGLVVDRGDAEAVHVRLPHVVLVGLDH